MNNSVPVGEKASFGRGSMIRREMSAGLTTFLTMSYIVFVQPAVLSGSMFGFETGMDFQAVMMATCLSAAIATALMGWLARYPIAQAPGMGQNFFFVFTALPAAGALASVQSGQTTAWQAALGVVFVSGVLFLLLSLIGFRKRLLEALSPSMQKGIAAGIGLFIAFIGLQNTGLIQANPGTLVQLNAHFASPDLIVFFFGLSLTAILLARRVRGALLWGILGGALLSVGMRLALPLLPERLADSPIIVESMLATRFEIATRLVSAPPSISPTFLKLNIGAAFTLVMLPYVIVFLFMDVFDTMGTLVGVCEQAGFMKDGRLPRAEKAMLSDAVGTVIGATLGTSTVTSFIESAAGVQQGGRTGLTAYTVAGLFLLTVFFSPLVGMIGSYAPITAPALVVVGAMMLRQAAGIQWDDSSEAIPAFMVMIGIPLSFSIADGLALGFIGYPIVKGFSGRHRDVSALMWIMCAVLLVYFMFLRTRIAS